ncbi:Spy/CpxP family protein refolding chaperone [Bauldia sp.]|uniref:Spy/CpxP family protein refolding chaperone n=1 Tax=Bauldia sp. TaxID=2575872 RepID=UPI003BA8AA45
MSPENQSPDPDMNHDTDGLRPTVRRRILGLVAGTLIAVGAAGAFASSAMSDDRGWSRWAGADKGHHGMMFRASMDPAEVTERVEKMVAHLAIEIDATDEQQAQLTTIFVGAAENLMDIREQAGDRGETATEVIELLTGPTVDPVAVEAFRAEKMGLADEASRVVAGALVEAAEVMTPDQRAEIGDRLDFFAKMSRHHRR